ncbi:TGF-beta-activated kinase 1 and MAP3K7-binding protein 1-like [Asbolus verrucosus]|uniref:TGF-beta-activated kinase 1 and MAP3K7-binding protein 1 n=1 Tax=Asbolus verrucosus TaxID=1661398 RepID=A0A482W2W8_ASBVE|nr:TGF-beta-activated kinase 1 and MAP3K7-binding protein 1-like [Asbolus verrucosus]
MKPLKPIDTSYKSQGNWTDALTVCKSTGIGYSTNQIYREDGNPQEDHPYEDCSCHYEFNDGTYWYAVFDGHDGKKASHFSSQLTAEMYFSQLADKKTDEEIREIIRQAFISVESGYMQSIGDLLAERTGLQYDLPEGLNSYEVYQKVPHIVEKIKRINCELSSGAAAAVALIHNNKLYVSNVGNCRVLLCKTDANSVLKVVQLSVDHDLKNEDELLRLAQIGINREGLRNSTYLGNQENTRCLGNYLVKGGYKEFEDLSTATQEPVSAEPDIHGGITLDDSCRFLLLLTAELYKTIEEATGTDQVNKYIAQCVVEQFREQATLTGVAQAVVDKAVRLHHDWYMSNSNSDKSCSAKREDITLVLRNFNYPMPHAIKTPTTPSTNSTSSSHQTQNTLMDTVNSISSTIRSSDTTSTSTNRTIKIKEIGPDNKVKPYYFTIMLKLQEKEGLYLTGGIPD